MRFLICKTVCLLWLFEVLNCELVYSQGSHVFRLPSLTDVSKTSWRDSIYVFPEFRKGKITYTKGFELDYLFDLNYNVYYEKMDFISSSGDTLNITNTREIKLIQVGDKLFFHDYYSGFYEVLLKLPVALAVRNKFVLDEIEYNSGIKGAATFTEVRGVVTDYDRLYKRGSFYFFIDPNNQLHKATRASILKLFPAHQVEIQGYLLENPVYFESQEDLIRLTNFCNQFLLAEQEQHVGEVTTVKLIAGSRFPFNCPRHVLYRFPEFQSTKITGTDKSTAHYPKVNYNLFTGKMDIIDIKGDTVPFKKWRETRSFNLDGRLFYQDFKKGYMEIILQGPLTLAVRTSFELVTDKERLENAGFMDQANASIVSNEIPVAAYDRLYQLKKTFYLMDRRNEFQQANKLSILRLMRRDKEKIVAFMNENNISFDNEHDLVKLVNYCNRVVVE